MTEAILLCGLVWIFLLYSIFRGYRREWLDRYTLVTWTIFGGIALVFILRIQPLQPFIDARFYHYPITFGVSLLAVVAATFAYSLSLKWVVQRSPEVYQLRLSHLWLIRAAPGVFLTLLLLMAAHMAGVISSFRVQYAMKWVEEGYGLLQSILVFVPINGRMYREERVFPMRVKHLITLVLTLTFAISAALSVISIPFILLTGHENGGPYLIPRGPIAAICLAILLMPHRWFVLLLLPQRLWRYRQLAAIERHLGELVLLRRKPLAWWQFIRPSQVEMGIYATLINILDHYRRVDLTDPWGCELYAQIKALLPQQADYEELVEALCRVSL